MTASVYCRLFITRGFPLMTMAVAAALGPSATRSVLACRLLEHYSLLEYLTIRKLSVSCKSLDTAKFEEDMNG
ncbi:hypothetical protein RJZ90_004589 [Blastomyces dermatitidis]